MDRSTRIWLTLAALSAVLLLLIGRTPQASAQEDRGRRMFELINSGPEEAAVAMIRQHGLIEGHGPIDPEVENGLDSEGYSLMHLTVYGLRAEVVKALVEAGADINEPGPGGYTPLDMLVSKKPGAVSHGEVLSFERTVMAKHGDLVADLLEQGAEGEYFQRARAARHRVPARSEMFDELIEGIWSGL